MRRNMFVYYFVLSLFVIKYVESNFTSDCGKKEKIVSYFDVAVQMINNVKSEMPVYYAQNDCTSVCGKKEKIDLFLDIVVEMVNKAKSDMSSFSDNETNFTQTPVDCADIMRKGQRKSGVYTICLKNRVIKDELLNVYCDMDTDGGGWTVIQRRGNYGNPEDYFFREWKSYKEGFGNIEKEFWLGNDIIFALTNQRQYSARFDLQDVKFNKSYALYDYFWIDDEFNNYTLHAENYSGDAGDSLKFHNKQKFSTKDVNKDNSSGSFGHTYKTGWWWYSSGIYTNLNGLYTRGENKLTGIYWYSWRHYNCLETTEIKIRPNNFVASNDFTTIRQ